MAPPEQFFAVRAVDELKRLLAVALAAALAKFFTESYAGYPFIEDTTAMLARVGRSESTVR